MQKENIQLSHVNVLQFIEFENSTLKIEHILI